jgi:hypothetical protein
MAEQSPTGASQTKQPTTQRRPSTGRGSSRPTPKRRTIQRVSLDEAPPARGLIRKEAKEPEATPQTPTPKRRLKRKVAAPRGTIARVTKPDPEQESDKPKVKIVTKTLPDGRVVRVKKKMVKKKVLKTKKELTPEEIEQQRLEQEQQEKEEAVKKAEEEARKKAEEAEIERIRLEKEAEEKRLEEERIRLEREAEQKRIEEEKERQEKERQRIYTKIEYCKGALSKEEQETAKKIAEEMVKRNIKWGGYISINSGIGGSIIN